MGAKSFASTIDGIKYFVANYGADLQLAMVGSGLYFAVAVGQKCLESGYGTTDLATLYNNFGGIRNYGSIPNAGIVQYQGTGDSSPQPYAHFDSPYACFAEYVRILTDPTKKYLKMGLLTAVDAQTQLNAIALGGYCEDPPGLAYANGVWPITKKTLLLYNIGKL